MKKNITPQPQLRNKEAVMLEIIVLNQFRDAIRGVSPRLYRSIHHRDEVYMAIIEALEDLEDELEEIEDAEEEMNLAREHNPKIK